ncbi:hypothetical protein FVEN_g2909 [Fusarium venenatum]|nr:hypothetical protein FVEN_g2909 [Fusarium venenatum]
MPESDSIPGTIHLVDVQCNLRVRHAGGGEDDIVLDPAPSDDPNDPLNWMPRRKLLSLVCQNFAYVSSNVEWIAKCIIQGFFVAPIESLPEISVTDIYFTHQRGTYIGIYALALAGSNYFAPVISGFIAEYQGWQWVVYWPAIFLSVVFVFLFLFMEETNYIRVARDINRPQIETTRASDENTSKTGEKEAEGGNQEVKEADETAQEYAKPKTFVQKMSLWHPFPGQSMARHAGRSIEYLSWPVIFFAGFSYGSYLIWFNVLNATASIVLSGPG